jgi:hypothetical protein
MSLKTVNNPLGRKFPKCYGFKKMEDKVKITVLKN